MKAGSLLDAASAHAVGFAWLRGALAPAGPYGEEHFATLEPFVPGQETQATARAARLARIAQALDETQLDAAREIARRVPDAGSAVARASMGDALDDVNFLELQRFFDACEALDALIGECEDLPCTASAPVRECAAMLERGRVSRFGFYLDDAFDGGARDGSHRTRTSASGVRCRARSRSCGGCRRARSRDLVARVHRDA